MRSQDIGALLGHLLHHHGRQLSVLTARSPSPRITLSTKLSRPVHHRLPSEGDDGDHGPPQHRPPAPRGNGWAA
jgi:hypothetical protein